MGMTKHVQPNLVNNQSGAALWSLLDWEDGLNNFVSFVHPYILLTLSSSSMWL